MGNILKQIQKGAQRVGDITGKVADVLGFFGADVVGLVEGRNFPYRDHFHQMLDTWDFSIPNRTLWVVHIPVFPPGLFHETNNKSLVNLLDINGLGFDHNGRKWKFAKNNKTLTRYEYQDTPGGCVFAQGVAIPGETLNVQHVKPENNRGMIPGRVATERGAPDNLVIEFRETNTSFIDNIVRPWLIMGSHYGFVARPDDDIKNVMSTVYIYQLGKTFSGSPNVHRKVWAYHNCVPIRINPTQLTYDIDSQNEITSTQWSYTHYTVEQLPDLPMQLVLDQIMGGGVMKLLDKVTKGKSSDLIGKVTKPIDSVKNAGKVLKNLF